jgi:hypothetical protein
MKAAHTPINQSVPSSAARIQAFSGNEEA